MARVKLLLTRPQILELIAERVPGDEIARRAGCTYGEVRRIWREAKKAEAEGFTHPDRGRVVALVEKGLSQADAAKALGCSVDYVYRSIRSAKADGFDPADHRGRPSKVDPAEVARMLAEGMGRSEIAEALGLKPAQVDYTLRKLRAGGGAEEKAFGTRPMPSTAYFVVRWPGPEYIPTTTCRCKVEPIPRCSFFYCPVCASTGWDWHPDLKATPPPGKAEPKKDAAEKLPRLKVAWSTADRANAEVLQAAAEKLTRREKRRLEFGAKEAAKARKLYARLDGGGPADLFEREGQAVERLHGDARSEDRAVAWSGGVGGREKSAAHPTHG